MGHHHHKHRSNVDTSTFSEAQSQNYNQNQNQDYTQTQNQIPNNNQNTGQNQEANTGGNLNMGPLTDIFKNVDMNQISSILSGFNANVPPDMNEADRGTYIINTLKSFLPDQRGMVLDEILKIYTLSKTISGK